MKLLLRALAGLLFASPLSAQTPEFTLWVTLGDSDQLVEVDPNSYRELRRITVDPKPTGWRSRPMAPRCISPATRPGIFR